MRSRFGGEAKTSILEVPRGLFVLKYVRGGDVDSPLVSLEAMPGSAGRFGVLAGPEADPTTLEQPGDAVALSSKGNVKLQVRVEARGPNASTEAHLELHPLFTAGNVTRSQQPADAGWDWRQPNAVAPSVREQEFRVALLGHVARRGDVSVGNGEWLCGPSAPAPIEGLVFRTGTAPESWLTAQVLVSGARQWSAWSSAGSFLGTKGRARPLAGLRVRLSDEAPGDLRLEMSALFLGAAVITRSGREIELVSAAGRDPLIGLRCEASRPHQGAVHGTDVESVAPMTPKRGRVRVFRAGSEVLQAATPF